MSSTNGQQSYLSQILSMHPDAFARIRGNNANPRLFGMVSFYQLDRGVLVVCNVYGLPKANGNCDSKIFAMHIPDGSSCTGNEKDNFANSGMHYNPYDCEHPHHAGDLPPLFASNGFAWSVVFTDRFKLNEVLGKTVIIHEDADDFHTQPSGNAGAKIACGVIEN